MNAVIPWLGPDSTELRYTLRSIEQYMPDISGVIIISYTIPSWLKNIQHIKFRDRHGAVWAHKNVWDKIGLVQDDIFLFVADDHYLLREYNAVEFPNYYTGSLAVAISGLNPENPYTKTIRNTIDVIGSGRAYNTHCPFVVERKKLQKLEKHNWNKPFGYCLKTLLLQKSGGVQCQDMKLKTERSPDLAGREWFSTSPVFMNRGGEALLKKLYPKKSQWEA